VTRCHEKITQTQLNVIITENNNIQTDKIIANITGNNSEEVSDELPSGTFRSYVID